MATTPELRTAILTILQKRNTWVPLVNLRGLFGPAIAREHLDAAILELAASHTVRLIPEANQKTLTEADWAAAIWSGGKAHHLLHINER